MRCTKCGMDNSNDNKYCVGCGELLEEKNEKCFCYNCGSENSKESKYCVSCGQSLNNTGYNANIPQTSIQPENSTALGLGIASLATSIVCCCFMFVGQIISIILGIISIVNALKHKNSKNTIGLVLSIIGICISLYFLVSFIFALTSGEYQAMYDEIYNQMMNGEQMIRAFYR